MKTIVIVIGLWLLSGLVSAQTAPFGIYIEPMSIAGLGGLQSFAHGEHQGKWLIVGGRLDGLHRRQPFAAFDVAGNNNQLLVIDPVTQQKWSAPLSSLSVALQEQLSATNMEFHQEGAYLYVIGGYGYHGATATRKTFDNLTAIDVPAVIDAVIGGTAFATYFRQITDVQFAVTGGHLNKIDETYYLLGGQRFDGNYNPMGHATFTQAYTNAIRKFTLQDDGTTLTVNHLPGFVDAANLHRRDYNATAQIMPNGAFGVTMFSGVFQLQQDLPFLNCVNVDSGGYAVNNVFRQYYNHYHCGVLPLYSAAANEMHTVFFGGMAQFYDAAGVLMQDNNVPFVKTIARVTRSSSGAMAEHLLPVEMPSLLGSGAEFISIQGVPQYENGVFKLDEFTADTTLVGYIYGGISSTAANIFFTNTGAESSASSQIFKVYVLRTSAVGMQELNRQSVGMLKMQLFPNPNEGEFTVQYTLSKSATAKILLHTLEGKILDSVVLKNLEVGQHSYQRKMKRRELPGAYFLTIKTPYESATQKLIVKP